jgi:UrcA family protein
MFGSSQQRDQPEGTTAVIRIILPAALAIATIASAAQAQSTGPVSYTPAAHQTVRFGDLDTSTGDGAQRLAFRIRLSAQALCGGANPTVRNGMGFDACVKSAVEQSAKRLNQPMVTAALGLSPTRNAYAGFLEGQAGDAGAQVQQGRCLQSSVGRRVKAEGPPHQLQHRPERALPVVWRAVICDVLMLLVAEALAKGPHPRLADDGLATSSTRRISPSQLRRQRWRSTGRGIGRAALAPSRPRL